MPYTQLSRLHVYQRTCPLPLKDFDDTASSDNDTLCRDTSTVDEWLARGTMVRQPRSIGKLSTEVLDMIFQTILHDISKTCTALDDLSKYHPRLFRSRPDISASKSAQNPQTHGQRLFDVRVQTS